MERQEKGSIDPCIIVRIIERTKEFFGIKACMVQKTRKELEAEKGQQLVWWAKLALKRRDVKSAEELHLQLQKAIEIGGYGNDVYLRRELRKIRNGIDCISLLEETTAS